MDQNTRDVLVARLATGGGLFTALIVASVVGGQQRGLEQLRWRRELFAKYYGQMTQIGDAARGSNARDRPIAPGELQAELDRALRVHFEIVMLRPAMENTSSELWAQTENLVAAATTGKDGLGRTLDEMESIWLDAWMKFRSAAIKDLGTGGSLAERARARFAMWRLNRELRNEGVRIDPDDPAEHG